MSFILSNRVQGYVCVSARKISILFWTLRAVKDRLKFSQDKSSRHPVAFWQVARSFSVATTYRSPQPTQRFISFCLFFCLCDTPSYEFLSLLIYVLRSCVICNHFKLILINHSAKK
uniref:Uncharacterized protein n=1 Tax=Trichogramma kaykai TaxID=54128 RepID=A0ABD2X1P7_9HYME